MCQGRHAAVLLLEVPQDPKPALSFCLPTSTSTLCLLLCAGHAAAKWTSLWRHHLKLHHVWDSLLSSAPTFEIPVHLNRIAAGQNRVHGCTAVKGSLSAYSGTSPRDTKGCRDRSTNLHCCGDRLMGQGSPALRKHWDLKPKINDPRFDSGIWTVSTQTKV